MTAADASTRGQAGGPAAGPVIVLAYAHSGVARLQRLLDDHPAVAFTSGTGIVPLCDQAADVWRYVEGRAAGISPLAATAIRAMADTLVTTILAGSGKRRWCEVAMAPAQAAGAFAYLYPQARFLCLHRACTEVIRDAIGATPWGLAGNGLGPYASAYPGNDVAAVAAYWRSHAGPLLDFEESHPGRCHRVRFEDFAADPTTTASAVLTFAGLDQPGQTLPSEAGPPSHTADPAPGSAGAPDPMPLDWIPAPMLNQINRLHARLGYPTVMSQEAPERDAPQPGFVP